jgi:hypothetical protein
MDQARILLRKRELLSLPLSLVSLVNQIEIIMYYTEEKPWSELYCFCLQICPPKLSKGIVIHFS